MPGQPSPEEAQLNAAIFTKMVLDAQKAKPLVQTKPAEGKSEPKDALDKIEEVHASSPKRQRTEEKKEDLPHTPVDQKPGFLLWLAHKLNLR